jgi:uncharacterized membrane protein YfbV (UPF0208 family)
VHYCAGVEIEKNEIGGVCSAKWGRGEACTGFWWENPRGKSPLRRPRRRWEYNIKVNVQEVGCGGMDGIELVQDSDRWRALVNVLMNLRVP